MAESLRRVPQQESFAFETVFFYPVGDKPAFFKEAALGSGFGWVNGCPGCPLFCWNLWPR